MVEVGYATDPAYRRQGYARAALRALLDRAAAEPGVTTVRASVGPGNTASRDLVLAARLRRGRRADGRRGRPGDRLRTAGRPGCRGGRDRRVGPSHYPRRTCSSSLSTPRRRRSSPGWALVGRARHRGPRGARGPVGEPARGAADPRDQRRPGRRRAADGRPRGRRDRPRAGTVHRPAGRRGHRRGAGGRARPARGRGLLPGRDRLRRADGRDRRPPQGDLLGDLRRRRRPHRRAGGRPARGARPSPGPSSATRRSPAASVRRSRRPT